MDDQIRLVPGEPYDAEPQPPAHGRHRRLVIAGLLALVAVAVGLQHTRATQQNATRSPSAQVLHALPRTVQRLPPWPQSAGVCGSTADAPRLSTDPVTETTGARVTVGGPQPAVVRVDTGERVPIPGLRLRPDQYVSATVRSGPASYVLVRSCQRRSVGTVLRAQAGRPQRVLTAGRPVFGLLDGGAGGVWAETYSGPIRVNPEAALGTTLVRLDRPGTVVELPVEFNVLGVAAGQVVATVAGRPDSAVRNALFRYDLATRRATRLGIAYSATESGGMLFWTSTACSATGPCLVHSYDLATGAGHARGYYLPLGAGVDGGVLSPDRRRLAFALQRETPDAGYRSDSTDNPSDLVVLQLTTGVLEPVPGIELAPGRAPSSLSFTADSRWLLVAPGDGSVLAWRSGQRRPMVSAPASPRYGTNEPMPRR